MEQFADKLLRRCTDKGSPICVGIDPVYQRLPQCLRGQPSPDTPPRAQEQVAAISRFAMGVLEAIAPHVPCVKLQSACFERYLWPGVEVYHRLIHRARQLGFVVIADVKRGDIGISAQHYAAGCLADHCFADLDPVHGPDAVTINAYLGDDGIEPFIHEAAKSGKGVFALVRTSNVSSDALQSLPLVDGRTVAQAVAQLIARLGSSPSRIGNCGYSLLGAVVGATKPNDIAGLRQQMPQQLFLVPGFGAQGGTSQAIQACFKPDRTGAIVTASRSVIYAYEDHADENWQYRIEQAAIELKHQVVNMLATKDRQPGSAPT